MIHSNEMLLAVCSSFDYGSMMYAWCSGVDGGGGDCYKGGVKELSPSVLP